MWQNKWTKFQSKNVQPVWHANSAHTLLVRHLTDLVGPDTDFAKECKSILLPLCGKSVDMVYMQQLGCSVVGVDIVANAMTAFRAETSDKYKWVEPQAVKEGVRHAIVCESGDATLELFQGDFFKLEALSALSGGFDYCLDRAGLAALPPTLHERYAERIEELLKPGGRLLLIVYEFDEVGRWLGGCSVGGLVVRKSDRMRAFGWFVEAMIQSLCRLGCQARQVLACV